MTAKPSATSALVILSIPAAARELGIPVKAVRRLVGQGLLPARMLGGRATILKRELEQYLAQLPALTTLDGALARAVARAAAGVPAGGTEGG
jgi:excisionase family DNA binding protein